MKKYGLMLFLFLGLLSKASAESFILNNQSHYPKENMHLAIQWASTPKDTADANTLLKQGKAFNLKQTQAIERSGKITLNAPNNMHYFRVLAWSNGEKSPSLATNWVSISENITYTLEAGHLAPVVLLSGMGC